MTPGRARPVAGLGEGVPRPLGRRAAVNKPGRRQAVWGPVLFRRHAGHGVWVPQGGHVTTARPEDARVQRNSQGHPHSGKRACSPGRALPRVQGLTTDREPRERPILGVSGAEAAEVLGVDEITASKYVREDRPTAGHHASTTASTGPRPSGSPSTSGNPGTRAGSAPARLHSSSASPSA